MASINTGILTNAHPVSAKDITEIERRVLENKELFAFLDEDNKICFALPCDIDGIKDLAWNNAYKLTTDTDGLFKKIHKKSGLKTFFLHSIFKKLAIKDSWQLVGYNTGLLDESLLDEFILE